MEKITMNHDKIKKWATKYKGKPQTINDPDAGMDPEVLRINFPGKRDDAFLTKKIIQDITWEEFFQKFEEKELAFIYEENINKFDPSLSYKFIPRENLKEK